MNFINQQKDISDKAYTSNVITWILNLFGFPILLLLPYYKTVITVLRYFVSTGLPLSIACSTK